MANKKELGKGLRALLSNIENTSNIQEKKEAIRELNSTIAMISTESVEVNPFQPRAEFDSEELMELAKSIKVHGLIQPITVRSMGGVTFQLISGERRLRASKMAGLKEIPAYIRVANDQEMLEMALIENIQRSNLNAIEIAISYQRLMEECNLTHEAMSERIGKTRSTVTNYVRLLKLPPEIQNAIKTDEISMGHARAIAGIEDVGNQLFAFRKTISEHLSVRALENMLKENKTADKQSVKSEKTPIENAEITRISRELSKVLGVRINIKRDTKGKGHFQIPFGSDVEFNSIYDLLKELE